MNNTKLKNLAELFKKHAPLYAVGGCVRDYILGIPSGDIDISSSIPASKVREILKDSPFTVQEKDLRMGTIIITCYGFKAEYTTFRTDSYIEGKGTHRPESVTFTEDMKEDALRRDFACNALYYDILKDEVVDLVGGKEDIEKKIIRCVTDPRVVFEADGLRILRMARFAAELGFDIDKETYEIAKENVWRIKDLSVERILVELDKIFVADTAHGRKFEQDGLISAYAGDGLDGSKGVEGKDENDIFGNAHLRGLRILDDIGALDIILPELTELKGLEQSSKWHLYDAYEHSLQAFRVSTPDIRWAALLHDIGKKKSQEAIGKMYLHASMGADIAQDICTRLKFPKIRTREICALVRSHMYDLDGNTGEGKLKWFIAERAKIMPQLLKLRAADAFASQKVRPESRMEKVFEEMRGKGVPMSIKDLKVNGRDLVDMNYPECERGIALYELWKDTVMNESLDDREKALEYLKKKIEREDKN